MPKASEGGESTTQPSNNLWIGNLTVDTTDSDLLDLFGRYGVVDSVTNYASRNYAFIYYKRLDDARAAKEGLQSALLRGNSIRIEFARPAKPAKNLWVGGISLSVSKEQLEEEFSKIGKLENFKFLRDRNSALVEYYRLEDAATAVKTLNGRRIGGEPIRVDFLRSQPFRRDNRAESHDSRDVNLNTRGTGPPEPYWGPPEVEDFPEPSRFGLKRHPHSGGRREGQPSRILWVGYPPSVQIDEHMLHNAMILFGEIERIKSYPSKHYSFVEFRSVDEARRAKEGLQGRLFNDPRIHIMFSSSELAPPRDSPGFFTGVKGPRPDMFFNDPPFGPGPMDFFGPNHPMAPNNFTGPLAPGMPGPNMLMRPFGPQGGFDQVLSSPEMLNELAGFLQNFQDGNPNNPMGPNWRRLSPAPGMNMIPSPAPGMRPYPPTRPLPGSWDGPDARAFERESKRSRFDGPSPIDEMPFPARMMDDQGIAGDSLLGFERPSFPLAQGQSRHSPLGMSAPGGEATGPHYPDGDICWRGIIAKGGTPVCRARCVPLGNGLDSQMPDIVNCSARTGLDMLAKHYTEASGFDIVFFLPDSEDDFASYTEFLHYLGAKNRAGVAKFDDGTTLFLVPPSDFLTKVLNVSGPERLYGVVLKLPQQKPSASVHQQQAIAQSQVIDRHHLPPLQADFSHLPAKEDQDLQVDYSRLSQERTMSQLPKPPIPSTEEPSLTQSVPPDYANNPASVVQSGLSLTPELLATLASLLPSGSQLSSSTTGQLPSGPSALALTSLPVSVKPDKALTSEGWGQSHITNIQSTPNHVNEEQKVNPAHQMGYQVNSQAPFMTQYPGYSNIPSGPDNSSQGIFRNSQIQDFSQHFPQHGVASRPLNNFGTPSQGGQFNVSQQANQPYQLDASLNPQMSYGAGNTTDATGYSQTPVFQQTKPSNIPSTEVQRMNSTQQLSMPPVNNNLNMVVPDQVQQLQSALSGVGQGTADGEADKNQRYQSTLQFAASLLLQIQQQQQQQQGNAQAANGTGNHQ